MGNRIEVLHDIPLNRRRGDLLAVVSLFVIGSLVYGVFIPSLGFYWDDWPVVWVFNALGPHGVARYFAGERPVTGWVFANVARIVGISPIGWQVLSLLIRCGTSAMLFIGLSELWPTRRDVAFLVGLLALLYPGFSQQPIALTYLSQNLSFFLYVLSLAMTIFCITRPAYRWWFFAIALTTCGLACAITEYFVGLELFRPFLIASLAGRETTGRDFRKSLRTALVYWSPFAAVWAGYLIWRGFVFHVATMRSYENVGSSLSIILRNPIHETALRISAGLHNILMATVFAWVRPFSPEFFVLSSRVATRSWMIAIVVVVIAIFTLRRLVVDHQPTQSAESPGDMIDRIPRSVLLLSVAALCAAEFPFLVPSEMTQFSANPSYEDRFTLPFIVGSSLMLTWILVTLGKTKVSRIAIVAVALFTFSAFQIQNSNLYRQDWRAQKSLFWQISWRAPDLKAGTSVFVYGLPKSLRGNHAAGLLNMLYGRDDREGTLNYFIFDLSQLSEPLTGSNLSYKPGTLLKSQVRTYPYQGTMSQSLVAWISPGGTFRVLSQPDANQILRCPEICMNTSQFSMPAELISNSGERSGSLLKIFGAEPTSQWLYYYQRAELARQLRDWGAVAALGDEARQQGYAPQDSSEWFPFIEGYARNHRYQTAAELSEKVLETYPDAIAPLSSLWLQRKREDTEKSAELNAALHMLGDKLVLED
jgi:hypothetical protein